MGLNLDVDHVAFASDRKYDGYQFRRLNPSEFAQIAGRAGRATRNGTFGTTGRCAPFRAGTRQTRCRTIASTASRCCNGELETGFFASLGSCMSRWR